MRSVQVFDRFGVLLDGRLARQARCMRQASNGTCHTDQVEASSEAQLEGLPMWHEPLHTAPPAAPLSNVRSRQQAAKRSARAHAACACCNIAHKTQQHTCARAGAGNARTGHHDAGYTRTSTFPTRNRHQHEPAPQTSSRQHYEINEKALSVSVQHNLTGSRAAAGGTDTQAAHTHSTICHQAIHATPADQQTALGAV